MFAIVSYSFDAYADLDPGPYKLLVAMARYSDNAGECYPLYRQLAADIRKSVATVSRWMAALEEAGCFTRRRMAGGGRYLYTLAERYRPRLPNVKKRFAERATEQVNPAKQFKNIAIGEGGAHTDDRDRWPARIRSWRKSRFWLPGWGPKPGEAGCFAPATLL